MVFLKFFFIRNRVKFQKKIFVKILRYRGVNLRFSILIVISNFENPRPYENNFFDFFLILLACLAPEQQLSLPASIRLVRSYLSFRTSFGRVPSFVHRILLRCTNGRFLFDFKTKTRILTNFSFYVHILCPSIR